MNQDILALIQENMNTFSKGQKRIAAFILDSYDKAAFMTASRLGKKVGVSESTVVRFAAELGYDGYPDMQKSLQKMIRNRLTSVQRIEVTNDRIGDQDLVSMVLQSDMEKIRLTLEELDRSAFDNAVKAIVSAKRIYIIGVRSSAAIASFLGFYFNLIFDNVVNVTAGTASEMFEHLLRVGEDDVVIGVSFPRYSSRTVQAMSFARDRGATTVAITDSEASPLAPICKLHPEGPQRHGLLRGLPGGPPVPGQRPAGGGEPARRTTTWPTPSRPWSDIWEDYGVYEKVQE